MSVSAPVDLRQLCALGGVAWRELRWAVPTVDREASTWLRHARRIADAPLRHDAVHPLVHERFNVQGASLFATLPRKRNLGLLRLLANFQTMVDFLDSASERPCEDMIANGSQLHRALFEALDPGGPISDHYAFHPWQDDAGYLRALIEACRRECTSLPSFDTVRPYVLAEASRMRVCAINHELDPAIRDPELEAWVRHEFPSTGDCEWFEISAASTSSVTIHSLLALAAERNCSDADVAATRNVYFPWVSLASTMLDSYADIERDHATGAHSYVSHYSSPDAAIERLGEIVARSVTLARQLPRGRRHVLIAAGMAAMYLSDPEAQMRSRRQTSQQILRSGGTLARLHMPILRTWRRLKPTG